MLLVLVLAAALGCSAALSLQWGAPSRPTRATGSGLADLPLTAQGPISELLGRHTSGYSIHGLRAVNPAQGLRLAFSSGGVSIAAGAARLRMTLAAYGYGSSLQAARTVAPRSSANRVTYPQGPLAEWFANGPLGLEQGFDIAAGHSANKGVLTLSLALSGDLAARLHDGSVLLEGHGARLRYGDLVASDARGRRLPSWLTLRGSRLQIRVDTRGARYPLRVDPLVQQAELTPAGGSTGNSGFGFTVATSGETIAVGDPSYEGSTGHKHFEGAVYIFQEPETGWANATETKKLTAPGQAASEIEQFGHSLAISGETLVVGTPGNENSRGAVYVFHAPGEDWGNVTQTATLTASDAHEDDSFGWSVALSGKTIAVGAPGHSPPAKPVKTVTLGGSAYVFVEPVGGWKPSSEYSAELNASGGEVPCGEVGVSVATTESTVVVGAPAATQADGLTPPAECKANTLSGHAYVFVKPGSWPGPTGPPLGPTISLAPAGSSADDLFGTSVAISSSADTILAGSPGQTVASTHKQGAAYVFTKSSGGWTGSPEQTELSSPKGGKGVEFGASVAISSDGGTAVVDQPDDREPSAGETSAGYVFTVPAGGAAPTLTGELTGTRNNVVSVSASGGTIVGGGFGAAFVFAPLAINVTSPTNGAIYTQGQTVTANYECSAPPGATIDKCTGTAPNGAPIDTSTVGVHDFVVEATDSEGGSASTVILYKVDSPSTSTTTEATSTTATTPTTPELTATQKAEAAAKAKAQVERENAEFIAWINAAMANPENATIGAKLLNEGGIPVSYKLVPEPGLIATTGSTVTWYKPKAALARVSSAAKKAKPVVVFKLSYRITRAGRVSFKVPLTSAGRALLKRDLKAHRSLVVYWTVAFTPQSGRPLTRTFKVTFKPARAKKHR
jgi:hypothetical protein